MRLATSIAWRAATLGTRLRGERAQGMVEYGLILVLVAIALTSLGGALKTVFNTIKNGLLT